MLVLLVGTGILMTALPEVQKEQEERTDDVQ